MLDTETNRPSELRLSLPWPDKSLSPNARVHHFAKAKKVKAARQTAWGTVMSTARAARRFAHHADRLNFEVVFLPPDRQRRDLDNCIASMKAATDGIAAALGTDDSRFISTYSMGEPVKGGAVLVTVRSA